MKKIMILAVLVVLLVPAVAFAGDRGHGGYYGGGNYNHNNNYHNNGYRNNDSRDLRDGLIILGVATVFSAVVNAVNPYQVYQPAPVYYAPTIRMCEEQYEEWHWARDQYGNWYKAHDRWVKRIVPCQ